MFNSQTRLGWIIVVGLLGMGLLSIHGCWRLHQGKRAARSAASNIQTCQELAAKIVKLRKQRGISSPNGSRHQVLADSLADALSNAGLAEDVVSRIEKLPPHRIPSSSSQYLSAQIELSGITLSNVVSVTRGLITDAIGWHATSIDLKAATSAGSDFDQTWDTTLVLTRRLIAP